MHTFGKVPTGLRVRAGGGRTWFVLAICLMLPVLLFGPAPARAEWSAAEVGRGLLAAAGGDLVAWVGSDGLLHALRRTTGEEWTTAVPAESGGVAELAAGAAGVAFIGRNQYLYLWRPGQSVAQIDTHSGGKRQLAVVGSHVLWLDKRDGYVAGEGDDWYNASVYRHDAGTGQTVRLVGPTDYPAGDLAVNGETLVWARYGSGTWRTYRASLGFLLSGGVAEEVYSSTVRLGAVPVGDYLAWAGAESLVLYRDGETQVVPGTAGASRPAADGDWLAFTRPVGGTPRLFLYRIGGGSPVEVGAAELFYCHGLRGGALAWAARSGGADRAFVAVNGAADQGPPEAPANLRAAAVSADSVTLVWDRASDDLLVTGYVVIRDGAEAGRTGALVTSFEDTGLEAGRTYTYAVSAEDAAGHRSAPAALEVTTAGARVRVLAPASVAEGASLTVTVVAYHATDLYAADVSLAFDPDVLGVSALSIAPPLNELILRQSYDNETGTAAWVAGRQGQVPGVSGDVSLAELTFSAVGVGNAAITPTTVSLADSRGLSIPVSSEGATVTVRGASRLTGTVGAEGLGAAAVGISVRLYDAARTLLAQAATDAGGRFEFANLPSGTYHLLASRPGCLTRYLGSFRPGAGERVEVPAVALFSGDVDRDDRVNLSDLVVLGLAYRTRSGDPNFNAAADLNADGGVDLLDFVLLARSYGLVGDTLP
ncbi:MAG: carboxypeptidase regulatory-like domain-containing protein [Desulfotomaculales bacterium]